MIAENEATLDRRLSLASPMTWSPTETKSPVTVFVHVHYPEIWQEMSVKLAQRLTLPFHLVLTSSLPEHELVLPETAALLSVQTLSTENRGRDILPFLRALAKTRDFEFGLKLHTKKSPQRADAPQWRAAVIESLLPPHSRAETIVEHMRADRRVGLVTPASFCLSVKPWVLVNAPGMSAIMSAKGTNLLESDMDDAFFAPGSMFWFRQSALAELADDRIQGLFEAEDGQTDGTIAHAMERLFPVEARRQGYLSLAVPALISSRPSMSNAELIDLARRYADIPTTYFPGPYIPALPPHIPALPPGTKIAAPAAPRWLRGLVSSTYHALPADVRSILRSLLLRRSKDE